MRARAFLLALSVVPVAGQIVPPPSAEAEVSRQVQDRARQAGDEAQPTPAATGQEDRSANASVPPRELLPGVPPLTDADRAAAFPAVEGHSVHDEAVNAFVLFDQLEWQTADGGSGPSWDSKGWIGRDRDRFWFRTEGSGEALSIAAAQAHLLYGRAITRWWDLVVGIRQDVRPGSAQTWAAVGLQGTAPYWFDVEATAYVGASGRTHVRLETEYELLLTNRLVLQPLVEIEIYGKSDPIRGIGAGLSAADVGLRLRYEFRREIAPYVGVVWGRQFFGTADLAEAAGDRPEESRLVFGIRLWF